MPRPEHDWRRGLEVLDTYDADRVVSEALADDLVNELLGLGPRRAAHPYPPRARRLPRATTRRSAPRRRTPLRVVRA